MKEIPKIHEGEYRFCLILWENEPISAAQLAKLCFAELGWKRHAALGVNGVLIFAVESHAVLPDPD